MSLVTLEHPRAHFPLTLMTSVLMMLVVALAFLQTVIEWW